MVYFDGDWDGIELGLIFKDNKPGVTREQRLMSNSGVRSGI